MESVKHFLKKMTIHEKVSLLVGEDFWHTRSLQRLGLPSIVVSDGPFGLRKVDKQGAGALETSLPATAFPTSTSLASSFNDELIHEIGIALAKECIDQGVDVLLGPGVNIKRNPLCGRNFEYFSEDPYVSGRVAVGLVKAIQSLGVGTSLKHFAVNNQEEKRLVMNAIIDERALFEIYLRAFEMVVKEAKPWTVMCSYNQVNGLHASRHPYLLTDILRKKWQYDGLVISDWGAVVDIGDSVKAGLNLEMPGRTVSTTKLIKKLQKIGVEEQEIDRAITPLLKMMIAKKARGGKRETHLNYGDHHHLAVRAATEGAVLLKNEGQILPLSSQEKYALIGQFAKRPRYQGSGSSRINPKMIETAFDAFISHQVNFEYCDGYPMGDQDDAEALLKKARDIAKNKKSVILMLGLPDEFEMEGMDRQHISLPDSHIRLIEAVREVNKNIVIVLSTGSAVSMPWQDKASAILNMHLGGQGSGEAIYQLLFGLVNPSGKLTETYPFALEDVPSTAHFGAHKLNIEYRESIYVGYRYFQKANRPVLFPFGFGLSYTNFTYKDIKISHDNFEKNAEIQVSFTLKNSGKYDGQEVVQLYVGSRKQIIFAPQKYLRNYQKVFLKAGEEKRIEFILTQTDFEVYDPFTQQFRVDKGSYKISIGASSEDIKLSRMIKIDSDYELPDLSQTLPSYYHLNQQGLDVSFEEFSKLYGRRITHYHAPTKRPFSSKNTLNDTRVTRVGRLIIKKVSAMIKEMAKGDALTEKVMIASFLDTPIRSYPAFSGGAISKRQVRGIVNLLNLRLIIGLIRLIPTPKQIHHSKQEKEK